MATFFFLFWTLRSWGLYLVVVFDWTAAGRWPGLDEGVISFNVESIPSAVESFVLSDVLLTVALFTSAKPSDSSSLTVEQTLLPWLVLTRLFGFVLVVSVLLVTGFFNFF
jgi:hypothetical protein